MSWIEIGIYIVLGFVALGKGAEWLVGGSSQVARRFGVAPMVIGLTVVAWGTSLPEVVVSVGAAMDGSAALSLGNVLGSNIANIGLVLGACALVLPSVLEGRLGGREVFWFLFSLTLLMVLCLDARLGRLEGLALLGIFALHTADVFRQAKKQQTLEGKVPDITDDLEALANIEQRATHWYKHPMAETVLGMFSIALGAWLVVKGAKGGAVVLDIDERIVGLTVVALGTSLPELAAGLGGAFKGEKDISLGNVVGSNIFNVMAVMGITALIHPLEAAYELAHPGGRLSEDVAAAAEQVTNAFAGSRALDFPMAIAFSLFVIALPILGGKRYGRIKGGILLGAYVGYSFYLFYAGPAELPV